MKTFGHVFWLLCKRFIKRPFLLLLYLCIPLLLYLIPYLNQEAEEVHFKAGYVLQMPYTEPASNPFFQAFEKQLEKSTFVTYQKYTSAQEMEKALITGAVSCGFLLEKDFVDAVETGDFYKSILICIPQGMNYGGILREDFASKIYKTYSALQFCRQMQETVSMEQLMQKFQKDCEQSAVFGFQYVGEGVGEDIGEGSELHDNPTNPESATKQKPFGMISPRGLIAFLTFVLAMMGAIDVSRDKSEGIGAGASLCTLLQKVTIFLPVMWGSIFLLVSIWMERGSILSSSWNREFVGMAGYAFVLWVIALCLGKWCPEKLLIGLTPVVLLVGILATPVLFSFGEQIPLVGWIAKAYPVTWYLYLSQR